MFAPPQLIGRAVRKVRDVHGRGLEKASVRFDVTMLFGGQIKGGRLRLFMIYSAGNFIEATRDTPYLQIGEHKYGKPILDRAVDLRHAPRRRPEAGLISMDSTMRSNLGVGLPIDIAVLRARRADARSRSSHRQRRALFPRPARALVGGAAGGAHRHSAPALPQDLPAQDATPKS